MKLSKKFLSDYIKLDTSFEEVANKMPKVGNEYDNFYSLVNSDPLVIGEIIEVRDHKDSDHLHVCKVNIGKEVLQIVCGAPNVRKGLKTIVAVPGTKLPGGTISKSIIRGEESNGMMVAVSELGLEHKFLSEKDIDGIHEFDENAPVGEDALKYLELDDEVIDFDLTANRGDLLSVLGFAYEIGAVYEKEVKLPDESYEETEEDINNNFCLNIKTDKCYTFLSKRVNNIEIKESPLFIRNRLIASGIRPINNVVDISNYIMLETGQPLHYYDADKLGSELGVRLAKDKETLKTLDNKDRTLADTDIIIVNKKDEAIGLAGVMGGYSTEIDENTKNIIIEAAIFNPTSIRFTSKKILRSEASNRFEKGLDVNRCYMALNRSCNLLSKYASGKISKGLCEYNTLDKDAKVIEITTEFISKILGFEINEKDVLDVFNRLGFKVTKKEDVLLVSVPTRRIDISIKEDLVEEVGRIYGVDNIVGTLPYSALPGGYNKLYRDIKNKLAYLGLNETSTYTLISEEKSKLFNNLECFKVLDPMSEERLYLRNSLIPSLLDVYDYNNARNVKDINIFEIGKGFYLENNTYKESYKLSVLMSGNYFTNINGNTKVDFYILKGILEELLDFLGYNKRYSLKLDNDMNELHPYQRANININGNTVGFIGKLHPTITKNDIYVFEFDLDLLESINVGKLKYKDISKFPSIEKDASFVLDDEITSEEITTQIKKCSSNLLKDVYPFDIYKEKLSNKKSITYRLVFESSERTLTDEEVLTEFNKIIDNVCKKYNASIKNM